MIDLRTGDCLELMRAMPAESVDACVTDPPYHLTSIVDRFGKAGSAAPREGVYRRAAAGFMGQSWDGGDVAFRAETWAEVLRVLKPGGHVVAFGGPRTYHRLACAIEDAGFVIADSLAWLHGQGFPKSHNLSGEWEGWGSALKPAFEPAVLARKPRGGTIAFTMAEHGTGALNIDGCRIGSEARPVMMRTQTITAAKSMSGVSTGATPSGEMTSTGRWPANVIHDGSDEVLAAFPDSAGARAPVTKRGADKVRSTYNAFKGNVDEEGSTFQGDAGSAARFFYCAKPSRAERGTGNTHPTVKPVALMRYLIRLVTPPGGLVLDPFAGSGTTGVAAQQEGMSAILCELNPAYADMARDRIAADRTALMARTA